MEHRVDITPFQQYELNRQQKVVEDAMVAMELEIWTEWWPRDTVERFLNYVYTIGLNHRTVRHGNQKRKPVAQIQNGQIIHRYHSITDAANAVHCNNNSIYLACTGKNPTAKGFRWEYI